MWMLRSLRTSGFRKRRVSRYTPAMTRFTVNNQPVEYKIDPRTPLLYKLAEELNLIGPHARFILGLEEATEQVLGRRLAPNVDGAIAGLMCDLNLDPGLGKAFFIIGRAPGYVAHAHEQVTAERPFKAPEHDEITYTGPERRSVPPAHEEPV